MDIAFVTDHLLYRDEWLNSDELMVEYFLSQNKKLKTYTLAHQQKVILGPLEQNPVRSTFLSGIFSKRAFDWGKLKLWPSILLGQALKDVAVDCQIPVVFCHAKPWAIGIPRCQSGARWVIVVDRVSELAVAAGKLTTRFLVTKAFKAVQSSDTLFFSDSFSAEVFSELYVKLMKGPMPATVHILPPPLDLHEFKLVTDDLIAKELTTFPWQVQKFQSTELTSLQSPFRVICLIPQGDQPTKKELAWLDNTLEAGPAVFAQHAKNPLFDLSLAWQQELAKRPLTFLKDSCDGVLSAVLSQAQSVHTYTDQWIFPRLYFLGLAVGTPSFLEASHPGTRVFLKDPTLDVTILDRERRRQQSMRYHSLRWKSELIGRCQVVH